MKKVFSIAIFVTCLIYQINASTISSNAITGNWSSPASWAGGIVPGTNDSAVIVNGANITLNVNAVIYKIIINTGGTLNIDKILTLQGNTILGGNLGIWGALNLDTGTIQLTGNLIIYGTFNCGTGTIIFNGNDAQTMEGSSPVFYNLRSLNTNNNVGKGVALHSVTTTIKGNFIADGVFTRNSQYYPDATVIFNGTTQLSGAFSFYLNHVVINAGATVNAGSKTIYLYGNFSCYGTFISGSGTLSVKYDTYSSCQPNGQKIYINNPDSNILWNLTIDKTTGSVEPDTNNVYGNLWILNNFLVNNGVWNVNGAKRLYVNGNFTINPTATFTASTGRVLMKGTNITTPQTLSPSNSSLYKLTIDNSGAGVKLSTNVTVTFEMVLTNGIVYTRNGSINYEVYISNSNPVSIPTGYSDTSYIAGNLKRAIVAPNNYTFPVGVSNSVLHKYRPVNFNLTATGGASTISINQDSISNSGNYYASWWVKILPNTGNPAGTVSFAYNLPADFQSAMNECGISALRGTQPPATNWNYVLTTSIPASGGANGNITSTLPTTYSPYAFILGEPVPVASNVTICDGNTATLNITSPTGYGTFNWYNTQTGGTAFLINNTSYTTPILYDTITYFIAHVNPQCEGHRYPVTVNVNNIPTSVFTTQNPVCSSMPAIVTYTGTADASASYSWNFGGATANPGTGQGPQQLTGTAGQTYNISMQVTQNGCTSTVSYGTVTLPTALSISLTHTNSTCGNSNGSATVNASGGWGNYTYLWNNLQTTATNSNLASGTYFVTVTDQNGCSQNGSTTVSDVGGPSAIVNVINNISCFGGHDGKAEITATGTGTLTYTWSNGVTGNGNDSIVSVIDTLTAGNYQIAVSDQNGCQSVVNITLTQPQALAATFTVTNALCFGQNNGTINSAVNGGTGSYHFSWLQGSTQQNLINLYAGIYYVTITDDNNCSLSQQVTVNQPDSITIFITEVPISCFGVDDGILSASVNGGTPPYTYSWSNGDTNQITDSLSNGIYFVIISDINGCNNIQYDTLLQPTPVNVVITSLPATCNGFSDGMVEINVTGGTFPYSYEWNNGATTEDLNAVAAGSYWVTITDDNGCTAVASESVTEPFPLILSVSIVSVNCFGNADGSAIVNVQGGISPYLYQWNNGITTSDNTNIAAGNYSVTITDANGCHDTLYTVIDQPLALTVTSNLSHVTCFGQSDGSIETDVYGGTPPYSYIWNNEDISQNIYGLNSGTYYVTITDGNNCFQSQSFIITEPDSLQISTAITGTLCTNDSIGSISATITGGTPEYTYYWSNGDTSPSLTNLPHGTYILTVTDANLCLLTDTLILADSPPVYVNIVASAGQVVAEVTGGTYPFMYIWNNGSTDSLLTEIQSGYLEVIVTDQYGCTATASSDVNVEFEIPSAFTPNGDLTNDNWEIKGIEVYSKVTIEIFNRWGDIIFRFNGSGMEYKNSNIQWDGKYKGKNLPMGAYIYIVNLHNGEKPITGNVSIIR